LFCRNLLGLLFHPFKTIRIIYEEKDLSQAVLVFGFPLYLFTVGFVGIKGSRFLIGAPKNPWGPMARIIGVFLIMITFTLGVYLFYWLWRFVKYRKKLL